MRRILFCVYVFILGMSSLLGLEMELLWRQALGGKIDAYPAQGPNGDVYVIADDRAVHSIDPLTGKQNWIYRPGGRLLNLLVVAPDGTIYVQNDKQELFAVTPGGNGRWKLLMHTESSTLPAAAPDGRLILPLVGGRIICLSRYGEILWTKNESAEASAAPVIDSDGITWLPLTDGRIIGLERWGEIKKEFSGIGPASVLAMDSSERLWAGTYSGTLAVFNINDTNERTFKRPSQGIRIGAILTDKLNHGYVFFIDGTVLHLDENGNELSRTNISVSGGQPSQSANKTFFLPTSDGSIQVVNSEKEQLTLRKESILAEPLLTKEGILIAGSNDWILYAWKAEIPGEGWQQFRGGTHRAGAFPTKPILYDREEARKDVKFFVRELLARSEDIDDRLKLIRELESFDNSLQMYEKLPWADLLLEDLVAIGTIRRIDDSNKDSHPVVRERAYQLLGRNQDFRKRGLVRECVLHENDSRALAAGFLALGALGTDWDSASLRAITSQYRESMPGNALLTLATTKAFMDLIRYNGGITDPIGQKLIGNILRNAERQGIKEKVMNLLRTVSGL